MKFSIKDFFIFCAVFYLSFTDYLIVCFVMMFLGLAMYFFATSMALWKTLKTKNGRKSDMFVAVLYGLTGNK